MAYTPIQFLVLGRPQYSVAAQWHAAEMGCTFDKIRRVFWAPSVRIGDVLGLPSTDANAHTQPVEQKVAGVVLLQKNS